MIFVELYDFLSVQATTNVRLTPMKNVAAQIISENGMWRSSSELRSRLTFASRMGVSQRCLSHAALSCTSQLGLSFACNFHHLSRAACMCTSHSSLSFAILGCPSQWLLSSALVMCTSHLHLICTSPSHLSLLHLTSSPLHISCASLIAPLACTSDLRLL